MTLSAASFLSAAANKEAATKSFTVMNLSDVTVKL